MKKPLPIGVENFEDIVKSGYYYVDKTMFMKELLDLKGKVNLFTRPRRFGKTLNLSMLRYFFEDTGDAGKNAENKELFRDLKIMKAGEGYVEQMGKYPVINLTLKSAKQEDFENAYYTMQVEIASEFDRHRSVIETGKEKLTQKEYEQYIRIADEEADEGYGEQPEDASGDGPVHRQSVDRGGLAEPVREEPRDAPVRHRADLGHLRRRKTGKYLPLHGGRLLQHRGRRRVRAAGRADGCRTETAVREERTCPPIEESDHPCSVFCDIDLTGRMYISVCKASYG